MQSHTIRRHSWSKFSNRRIQKLKFELILQNIKHKFPESQNTFNFHIFIYIQMDIGILPLQIFVIFSVYYCTIAVIATDVTFDVA